MLIDISPTMADSNISAPANFVLLLTSAAPTMPAIEATTASHPSPITVWAPEAPNALPSPPTKSAAIDPSNPNMPPSSPNISSAVLAVFCHLLKFLITNRL